MDVQPIHVIDGSPSAVYEEYPTLLRGKKTAEQRQDEKDEKGMLEIVDVLRKWDGDADGPATPKAIIEKSPFGRERTNSLLSKLLHNQTVTRSPISRRGNRTHEYALSDNTDI